MAQIEAIVSAMTEPLALRVDVTDSAAQVPPAIGTAESQLAHRRAGGQLSASAT
jgi:hypothetical protein